MADGATPITEDGRVEADEDAATGSGRGSTDLDRLAAVEANLADVEVALARLDAGAWGTCEHCGAPLDQDVLAERPAARACPAHA